MLAPLPKSPVAGGRNQLHQNTDLPSPLRDSGAQEMLTQEGGLFSCHLGSHLHVLHQATDHRGSQSAACKYTDFVLASYTTVIKQGNITLHPWNIHQEFSAHKGIELYNSITQRQWENC